MGEVWGAMRAMCASRADMLTGTPNAHPQPHTSNNPTPNPAPTPNLTLFPHALCLI